jgi:tight adherence protein B
MTLFLSFVIITLVTFGIVFLSIRPTASQKVAEKRLADIRHTTAVESSVSKIDLAEKPGTGGGLNQLLQQFPLTARLNTLILHAGSTSGATSVITMCVGLAVASGVIAHMFLPVLAVETAAVVAGALVPYGKLKFQRAQRMKAINAALPDTIDLLVRALQAGHSMSSAIEVIAAQSAQPLGSEFQRIAQQQKFGVPFRNTLIQLTERIPSKDIQFLVTAILVQKETGGDLTEILNRTVEVIRERIRIDGEIKTFTAQGRLTGWILGCLPIVMLVLLNFIDPGYTTILFQDPLGQKLLYGGAILMTIGAFTIRSIVNIEV